MDLEDHLGDIIRKARTMTNVSAGAAAKATGLSEVELSALEGSGKPYGKVNFTALAKLIGLHPAKLEAIASGWRPKEADLTLWRELRVFTTSDEGITVNSYLIWDEVSREAALFDTGWSAKQPLETITTENLVLRHLFITHSHPDHIAELGAVREAFPRVRVHTSSKHAPTDQRNRPGDSVQLGTLRITHRDTPGHAEDGTTYLVENWPEDAAPVAIVGDAIFAGSMGRGNQSWELAREKVRKQILALPPDTLICPGHGPLTTVAQEKANNPFF